MSEPIEELVIEYIGVDLIDPNPWNPNKQSEVVARATRESLDHYGFVEPVLLRPKADGRYEIINGEHRWKEAQTLERGTLPAVVRDLDDDDAKKLTVILNETTGEPDVVMLGQLLAHLKDIDSFRVGLPYTDAELEHLLAIGAEDWDRFGNGEGEGDPSPPPVEFEIVLSFTDEKRHDQFRTWLGILEKEYGMASVTEAVYEAVRRAALAANQDAS